MKTKTWCLFAMMGLAILAWTPKASAEELQLLPEPTGVEADAPDACLDFTPLEDIEAQPALLLGNEGEAVAPKPPKCKTCQDQPFCGCTYQGSPRISCDPCCYRNPFNGQTICLS